MHIVICDDEKDFVNHLKALVQTELYQHHCKADIHTFTDSIEAIRYLEQSKFDVVFLDIEMPLLDGMELARRVRAVHENAIIIFVTCFCMVLVALIALIMPLFFSFLFNINIYDVIAYFDTSSLLNLARVLSVLLTKILFFYITRAWLQLKHTSKQSYAIYFF